MRRQARPMLRPYYRCGHYSGRCTELLLLWGGAAPGLQHEPDMLHLSALVHDVNQKMRICPDWFTP